MDQDRNSSFRRHLCSLALQLYLSAETPWVHKNKKKQWLVTQKPAHTSWGSHCWPLISNLWPGLAHCSNAHCSSGWWWGAATQQLLAFWFSSVQVKWKGGVQGTAQPPAEGSCAITAGLFIPPPHQWLVRKREGRGLSQEKFGRRGENCFISTTFLLISGAHRKEGTWCICTFIIAKHEKRGRIRWGVPQMTRAMWG